jgi:hypothetical protein
MDELVRNRLRPARHRGLTRPDRSPRCHGPSGRPPAPSQPKTRTSRRTRQRPGSHARKTIKINYLPAQHIKTSNRIYAMDRG